MVLLIWSDGMLKDLKNRSGWGWSAIPLALLLVVLWSGAVSTLRAEEPRFVDLSLLIAPEYPCTWTTFPPFQINHYRQIGPLSPYNSDILILDGNTGTQLDVPPHSVTAPNSGLPNAGPFGLAFTDKIEAWQFGGEACVVDCRDLLDSTPAGRSDLVTRARVQAWEKANRPLGRGDVVLFHSGFSDKYYRPFPEGRKFGADPVGGVTPGWPDPDPDCMEYLASRGVMTLGTDSTSMGPLPNLAEPTHFAGLKHGLIWTESGIGFGQLPTTGAFYCMIGPKHAGDPYSEGRAFGVVGNPLASRLIASARAKKVVDLSVTLADDMPSSWPGKGVGNHRQSYMTIRFGMNPNIKVPFMLHMLDSHTGTHLVPPSYALPKPGFDNARYAPEVRQILKEYEAKYGVRGTSTVTTEQVPLAQTCGVARVVDVANLRGTTRPEQWPTSPRITAERLRQFEAAEGMLKRGEVVIFRSGWSDEFYHPLPMGEKCQADPLNGKSEGWPALASDAVVYLAERGIACVGTDAPTLGGVDERESLWTYWALGTRGMVGVEFLTNLRSLKSGHYFVFAPIKVRDCHGGPGRAIAFE
jgi:kynurenine formamidase